MKNFIPTSEKISVANYPYGYTLKTTLFDEIEFNPKKGYRSVKTTINPKNGRLNAPKKSTYSELLVRSYDENGHIQIKRIGFNGGKEINIALQFINENFDMFSDSEIAYFYANLYSMTLIDIKAKVIYCGAKLDDLKPLYDNVLTTLLKGYKEANRINLFDLKLDLETIETKLDKDFKPFG